MAAVKTRHGHIIQDPPLVHKLLNDPRAAWLWLALRVWLGWQWVTSAQTKIFNPAWVGGGEALRGFWERAVLVPDAPARPMIAFDWYRSFLQAMLDAGAYVWFGKLVAYGELLVGIGLIIGAFTGIAAFFGAFMNWNFMMAGTASTNPALFVIAIGIVLAWKVAGYFGADYFLLRWLGTPWQALSGEEKSTGNVQVFPQARPAAGD
jgi:thiosulfate dehydrogenase (quinone) large subunit